MPCPLRACESGFNLLVHDYQYRIRVLVSRLSTKNYILFRSFCFCIFVIHTTKITDFLCFVDGFIDRSFGRTAAFQKRIAPAAIPSTPSENLQISFVFHVRKNDAKPVNISQIPELCFRFIVNMEVIRIRVSSQVYALCTLFLMRS